MDCRPRCAACCIAPSISSPIPGMPEGKPAGVACVQLDADLRCRYGAAAVARCHALFSMEANAAAISQVYRSVTAERSAQQSELSSFA